MVEHTYITEDLLRRIQDTALLISSTTDNGLVAPDSHALAEVCNLLELALSLLESLEVDEE